MENMYTPKRPDAASADFPRQKNGPAANVHAIFDRVENMMPRFVGQMRALLISLMVAGVVTLITITASLADARDTRDATSVTRRYTWAIIAVTGLYIAITLQAFVFEKVYAFELISKNSQHFANLVWLKKYSSAVRVPALAGLIAHGSA